MVCLPEHVLFSLLLHWIPQGKAQIFAGLAKDVKEFVAAFLVCVVARPPTIWSSSFSTCVKPPLVPCHHELHHWPAFSVSSFVPLNKLAITILLLLTYTLMHFPNMLYMFMPMSILITVGSVNMVLPNFNFVVQPCVA